MLNLLFISESLDYADGVSTHLYNLTRELSKNQKINFSVITPGGESLERFIQSNIDIIEDKTFKHRDRSLKNFSTAVKNLIRLTRQKKIDIIHSHNHYAANIAYYTSKFNSAKTVQTIHGLIPAVGYLKHFRADKFITVNESSRDFMIKSKIALADDVKFIRQGFQFEPIAKSRVREKNDDITRIICASRFDHEKGVDLYIRASRIVQEKFNGKVEFLIAGNGNCGNDLKKLSRDINADVTFLGTVKDIPELLSTTDVFVMPTRAAEGFPMSLVEAGFAKNLIITSDFSEDKNIFENDIDALIFKKDDHEDLSQKILSALANPERSLVMAGQFHNKALKLFDIKTMVQKHIEVYSECQAM